MSAAAYQAVGGLRQDAAAAIDARGTDESVWAAAHLPGRLPRLSVPRTGPVVVVAAHPDDEVLGVGGTIAALVAAGAGVHTVCLTDGEASHDGGGSPRIEGGRGTARERLAARRRGELAAALAELGPLPAPVHAALPDTALDEHETEAAAVLGGLLAATEAALCLAPWAGDLHSDHEAAGRAAARACARTGTTRWSYPVWMWHWARPDDPRVPWHRAAVLPLGATARRRKKRALARFASQLEPRPEGRVAVLPPHELAHHTRAFETVLR
ncbi:PIG-L deacetylase family protein [Streptomyces flavofungini]|uniref:PIG-L deacetylase family protein n=1 Tax=Streptomyces flavofungini TaxID=68200 RepID=UPI0034DFECF6